MSHHSGLLAVLPGHSQASRLMTSRLAFSHVAFLVDTAPGTNPSPDKGTLVGLKVVAIPLLEAERAAAQTARTPHIFNGFDFAKLGTHSFKKTGIMALKDVCKSTTVVGGLYAGHQIRQSSGTESNMDNSRHSENKVIKQRVELCKIQVHNIHTLANFQKYNAKRHIAKPTFNDISISQLPKLENVLPRVVRQGSSCAVRRQSVRSHVRLMISVSLC